MSIHCQYIGVLPFICRAQKLKANKTVPPMILYRALTVCTLFIIVFIFDFLVLGWGGHMLIGRATHTSSVP